MPSSLGNYRPRPLLQRAEIREFHERFLARLSGGGLWFLGGEPNTQDAAAFDAAGLRVLVARLSTYRDVAASITHGLLGQICREVPGVFVDYAYLPPPTDLVLFEKEGVPLWTGLTTKARPSDFDLVLISNSIAQELLNLPRLLAASGIPLWKSDRLAEEAMPLVLFGGNNAAAAAVIHGDAQGGNRGGLVDAAIVGEAEEVLPIFLSLMIDAKARGTSKSEFLRSCHGRVRGFYEPDRYLHRYAASNGDSALRLSAIEPEVGVEFPVRRAVVEDLNRVRVNEEIPVPYDTDTAGRTQLPIDLGCPCFCNFCREGWEVGPYRERSPERFFEALHVAKRAQGLHAVDFMSFNFNMHSKFYDILSGSLDVVDAVFMKSQRFDILAEDPVMAEVQHAAGKASFTCGLEGISERLRKYLHKNLSREQILTACRGIFEAKARELKLFLIATGREEESDFREWSELLDLLVQLRGSRSTRLIVSLTPLLPMPNTPSQFFAVPSHETAKESIVHGIQEACRRFGVEFRTAIDLAETRTAPYLLMGDRRVSPVLSRASIEKGFVFYDGIPDGAPDFFRRELTAMGVDFRAWFDRKGGDVVFSWDDVDPGTPKRFTYEKFLEAEAFVETEYCLDRRTVPGHCFRCEACTTPEQVRNLVRRTLSAPPEVELVKARRDRRRNPERFRFLLQIPKWLAATPMRFRQVLLARALLQADAGLTSPYLRPGVVLDLLSDRGFISGITVCDLLFERGTSRERIQAAAALAGPDLKGAVILSVDLAVTPVPELTLATVMLQPLSLKSRGPAQRQLVASALSAAGIKNTERRDDRGRRFEISSNNRLGLLELVLWEATGALETSLGPVTDLRPLLSRFFGAAPVHVEVLQCELRRTSTAQVLSYVDVETEDRENV